MKLLWEDAWCAIYALGQHRVKISYDWTGESHTSFISFWHPRKMKWRVVYSEVTRKTFAWKWEAVKTKLLECAIMFLDGVD
jgi:hypothetical protein